MHIEHPSGTKEGGLLKIEPKVPPVQNKRLATCSDIKETDIHIPSGTKYFTHTVLHYCQSHLIHCTENTWTRVWSWRTSSRGEALEAPPPTWCSKQGQCATSPLVFKGLFVCFFLLSSKDSLSVCPAVSSSPQRVNQKPPRVLRRRQCFTFASLLFCLPRVSPRCSLLCPSLTGSCHFLSSGD